MSLRQVIPAFEPAEGLGGGQVRPLRRMMNPAAVGYRAGGNVADILASVRSSQSVLIDGAVGVGKSTVLPSLIAKEMDMRVAHVVPSEFLAIELARFLNRGGEHVVTLITDVKQAWPDKGVSLMSASLMQAKMLSTGKLSLPECILYHDESHKADAWTYLLSKQWGTIDGVKKYINATATSGAGGFRRQEAAGKVEYSKVPAAHVDAEWRVLANQGFPWEISAIMGNTLIFEDDSDRAALLIQEYSRAGIEAYRLHSRMRATSFEAAMQSLRGSGLTVLIADSSFRDGYTWNVSTIIDTGSVITTVVHEGVPKRFRRDAYLFEMYQGAGRGARVSGQNCHVWQADRQYAATRMVLEEMEMEAVALVSRMLNTLPPIEVADCKMASGKVPRDLYAALSGGQPLALLNEMQLVDLQEKGYVRSPSPVVGDRPEFRKPGLDFVHPGMSATLANKRDFSDVGSVASASSVSAPSVTVASSASTVSDKFDEWLGVPEGAVHVQPGKYYYSPDVDMEKISSLAFPLGWKSVLTVYSPVWMRNSFVSLGTVERGVAVAALLVRFNQLGCELNAMSAAANDVKLLATSRSREAARKWFYDYLESVTKLNAEMGTLADILEPAVDGFTNLVELPGEELADNVRHMSEVLVASFREIRENRDNAKTVAASVDTSMYQLAPKQQQVNPMQVSQRAFSSQSSRGGVSRPAKPPAMVAWLGGGKLGLSVEKRKK